MSAMSRSLNRVAALVACAAVAACGPGGRGGGTGAGGGTTQHGQDVVVPPDVQRAFDSAVQSYEQAAQGGWQAEECASVSREFVSVSERMQGGLPEALFNAGVALENCGQAGDARDLYTQANQANGTRYQGKVPGYAPALVRLGLAEYNQNQKARAEDFFNKAKQADRRSPEAYTNIAILERERGQFKEAQLDLRRALAVNSDYMPAFTQIALLYLEISAQNPRMLDITQLVCQQAVSRAQATKAAPELQAPLHNIWGLALIQKGDVVRAVEQFDQARQLNPDSFDAHMNFGAINLSFRGFEAAADAFGNAVRLRPEDYDARIGHGAALRGLERFDEARAAYEKAKQIDARRPDAYYNLGILTQDYLIQNASGMDAQVKILNEAKQIYRDFLSKCQGSPAGCTRHLPGEPEEDMREAAQRRIKACDETIAGMREAERMAAEAAQLQREAERMAKQPPPPPESPPAPQPQEGE